MPRRIVVISAVGPLITNMAIVKQTQYEMQQAETPDTIAFAAVSAGRACMETLGESHADLHPTAVGRVAG